MNDLITTIQNLEFEINLNFTLIILAALLSLYLAYRWFNYMVAFALSFFYILIYVIYTSGAWEFLKDLI